MKRFLLTALFLCFSSLCYSQAPSLRLLTINIWSGLDYRGSMKFGELEPPERRDLRFESLTRQIRSLGPDIIFIQEANPVGSVASRLAESLGMDEIDNVCLAGIKLGPLGMPANLKEGMIILAKSSLRLEKVSVWKLSGSFGLFGDAVTIHFDESNFALVGKIEVGGAPVYLINLHLSSEVPYDSVLESGFRSFTLPGRDGSADLNSAIDEWKKYGGKRMEQAESFLSRVNELPDNCPIIAGGDFNAVASSPEMMLLGDSGKFFNPPISTGPEPAHNTWEIERNENVYSSTILENIDGTRKTGSELISALYDRQARKIDHLLFNHRFSPGDIRFSAITLDSAVGGILPSDHFGLYADLDLTHLLASGPGINGSLASPGSTFEPLPVFSYDTDAGFGYGAKAFLLNSLGWDESFDALFFNSSKGERWYRFVFSIPDFELRQGKIYPVSFDLTVDYDKWIKSSFFGIGSGSSYSRREYYTKEPLELSLTAGRGFTRSLVAQAGIKHKILRNYNLPDSTRLSSMPPGLTASTMRSTSLFVSLSYDSRNSYIHPSRGTVLKAEFESDPGWGASGRPYQRAALWLSNYFTLFDYPKTILSTRGALQNLSGDDLPLQALLALGGGNSLRGSPQDRYLDKVSAVVNLELRFPIYWRFGGIVGYDAGKVWNEISRIGMSGWSTNPAAGLRFYFDTFIVRLDLGFGKETTGFYLNFGHLF